MDVMDFNTRKEFLEKAEDFADLVVRKTRRQLPHIARFCLVSTFIEDGFRLLFQWGEQVEYISSIWSLWYAFSALFILINIITQFGGSGMVLCRYQVKIGVGTLMATVILQTIGYGIYSGVFLLRNISLCGSLFLLLAECMNEKQRVSMAGLPSTGENASQNYLLLIGRVMVVLMFTTIVIYSHFSFFQIIWTMICMVGILCVAVGYKTKLTALGLVFILTLMNVYYNAFWTAGFGTVMWDYMKYDFFQTWSVIGGLLYIVAYGAGGVSVDDYKKKW